MKSLLVWLVSALALVGCGDRAGVPEELQDYAQWAESVCGLNVSGLDGLAFGDLPEGKLGKCTTNLVTGATWISIDRASWSTLSTLEKMSLFAHEVLHCGHGKEDLYELSDVDDWMYYAGQGSDVERTWAVNFDKYCKRGF